MNYPDDFEDNDYSEWEAKAQEAVDDAIQNADFDELNGLLIFYDPHERRRETVCRSAKEVQTALENIYDSEWHSYVPYDSGEAVFEPDATDTVDDALREHEVENFFIRTKSDDSDIEEQEEQSEEEELIISAEELLKKGGASKVIIDTAEINDELIAHLAKHPDKMHDISPRKFEELIAELFKDKGYEVELCRRGADGGVDVYAMQKSSVGSVLILIQCKQYGEKNPVGVKVVRELYGLVEMKGATKGLIATTSYFTKPAKIERERERVKFRMDLADKLELQRYLQQYKTIRTS